MQRPHPNTSPSQFDPEVVRALVARTRAEQGLPPTITDPAVLARLAVLCRPNPGTGGKR